MVGGQGRRHAFPPDVVSARALAPCLFMLATGTQAMNLGSGCTLYFNGLFCRLQRHELERCDGPSAGRFRYEDVTERNHLMGRNQR
jgi:hypothetical protein